MDLVWIWVGFGLSDGTGCEEQRSTDWLTDANCVCVCMCVCENVCVCACVRETIRQKRPGYTTKETCDCAEFGWEIYAIWQHVADGLQLKGSIGLQSTRSDQIMNLNLILTNLKRVQESSKL